MAQKLYEDKITALSESSGTITLAASARLTIGGQQYLTSSALNIAANLSAANTRYQIYAVQTAGVVSLVISANENSVGPVGYDAWKLVGSYYTNGLSTIGFGSFVNIEGVPKTEAMPFDLKIYDTNESTVINYLDYTDGSGSYWNRIGDSFSFWHRTDMATVNSTTNGVGAEYRIRMPDNLLMLNGKTNIGNSGDYSETSVGIFNCNNGRPVGHIMAVSTSSFRVHSQSVILGTSGAWSSTRHAINTSNIRWSLNVSHGSVFVSGWSNTQIKDL